jgi:hypothetical protein
VSQQPTDFDDARARISAITLLEMITSYRLTQALHVAAKLGLADLLRDGPRRSDDLAVATGTHRGALYRLMRALAAKGIFHEAEAGGFELTALGHGLRSDISGSMRPWAIMAGGDHHWLPWQHLLHSVQTGQPAFEAVLGAKPFEYYAAHAEAGRVFHAALGGLSQVVNATLSASYDFSSLETVVDVGGGGGALLLGLLARHPAMRGVLFDEASVLAQSVELIRSDPSGDRCELVAGNFFEEVPTGGDAYILKHILHDWDDERSMAILKRCRAAMRPGARVLIIEMLVEPGTGCAYPKFLDLEMLVSYTGRERTAHEYAQLLSASGFSLAGITPTDALVSVIEGRVA